MQYNSGKTYLQSVRMNIMSHYSYAYGAYLNENNEVVQDIKGEITREYIKTTGKELTALDLNTMLLNIKNLSNRTIYDFDNVSYKAYMKKIAKSQNIKEVKELKERFALYLESIQDRKSNKKVFFLQGMAGEGKTTYAKILGEKYYGIDEVFISENGSKGMLDSYHGEKVLILDDLRDSDIRYSQLLKLLDNNTSSNAEARYHNKNLARCKLIIITSTVSPLDMYKGIEEERYQFYRRIKYMRIQDGFLYRYNYNRQEGHYENDGLKNISAELQKYYDENPEDDRINLDDLFDNKKDINLEEINEDDLPF